MTNLDNGDQGLRLSKVLEDGALKMLKMHIVEFLESNIDSLQGEGVSVSNVCKAAKMNESLIGIVTQKLMREGERSFQDGRLIFFVFVDGMKTPIEYARLDQYSVDQLYVMIAAKES